MVNTVTQDEHEKDKKSDLSDHKPELPTTPESTKTPLIRERSIDKFRFVDEKILYIYIYITTKFCVGYVICDFCRTI